MRPFGGLHGTGLCPKTRTVKIQLHFEEGEQVVLVTPPPPLQVRGLEKQPEIQKQTSRGVREKERVLCFAVKLHQEPVEGFRGDVGHRPPVALRVPV